MTNKPLSAARVDVGNATDSRADSAYCHTHRSILCNACHEQYRADNDPSASP